MQTLMTDEMSTEQFVQVKNKHKTYLLICQCLIIYHYRALHYCSANNCQQKLKLSNSSLCLSYISNNSYSLYGQTSVWLAYRQFYIKKKINI